MIYITHQATALIQLISEERTVLASYSAGDTVSLNNIWSCCYTCLKIHHMGESAAVAPNTQQQDKYDFAAPLLLPLPCALPLFKPVVSMVLNCLLRQALYIRVRLNFVEM
eukprot:6186858-Pleurochrysis_carterae.AAC.3